MFLILQYLKQVKLPCMLYYPNNFIIIKSKGHFHTFQSTDNLQPPELNFEYICNPINKDHIKMNNKNRKGIGDIDKVLELNTRLEELKRKKNYDYTTLEQLQKELLQEANKIPNETHPNVLNIVDPVEVESIGIKTESAKPFPSVAKWLGVFRTEELGIPCGRKSYQLKKSLAMLERALIKYSIDRLMQQGFDLISVPNILHPDIIERCGTSTTGKHTQIYHIEQSLLGPACLSGTSEIALAAYFMNCKLSNTELPKKVAAISRCYRAESGMTKEEGGLYRVHQFTKVEMFAVTANEIGIESEQLLNEFVTIQKSLFSDLGLHFKILDMPSSDLAAAAYRKYDIEAWMPNRDSYGEISSASNCTDYQSRRLHIKYYSKNNVLKHAHTVNGTACAVPRMLIAIFGTFQDKKTIKIPEILIPYMNGLKVIEKIPSEISYYIRSKS